MKEFNEFKSILLTFSKSEKRQLLHRLRLKSDTQSDELLSSQLVELMSSDHDQDEKQIQRKLYGKLNPSAFRKLLSRNYEKVFDTLISREEIEKSLKFDQRARDIFLLERSLLISEILRFRGLFDLSDKYLELVIREAKSYEHYGVLVNALEKKLKYASGNIDQSRYKALEVEINFYMKCKLSLNYVLRLYSKYVLRANNDSKRDFNIHSTLLLKRIDDICQQTNSNTIRLYKEYIYLQYLAVNSDFLECFKAAKFILDFTQSNRSIFSRQRMAFIYFNLSLFSRFLHNFDLSIQFLEKANKNSVDSNKNIEIYYENSFLTYFMIGDKSKARYYLNLFLSQASGYGNGKPDDLKKLYYNLVLKFVDGSFQELTQFYTSTKISSIKSSSELSLNIRLVYILALIELERFDLADRSIENLRKYFDHNKKTSQTEAYRLSHISKILLNLKSSSYSFKKVVASKKYLLESISNGEFHWRPNSPELLIFEEWFEAKVKGVSYNHKTAVDNVKKRQKAMLV